VPVKKLEQEVVKAQPRADRRSKKRTYPADGEIAHRAYQLYLERGGEHGRDWEDWLRAERELMSPSR
jgi:hypothetical protein